MKISEMIAKLQEIRAEHGDLEAWENPLNGGARVYESSDYSLAVAFIRKKKGKERNRSFLYAFEDPKLKDFKVLRV